jgi:Core-2/I-Branching enzyme
VPNTPIGFVLLTHDRPLQASRLVERLNAMFDSPPIAWHHDFDQSSPPSEQWANVTFVRPHVATSWGTFSVAEAAIHAMRDLYSGPAPPDWCAVVSGADYPIKPAARILDDLNASDVDAHIELFEIKTSGWVTEFEEDCFRRYHTVSVGVGTHRRRLGGALARRLLSPFSDDLRCYAGSFWFSANATAVGRILDVYASDRRLARHLRRAPLGEECYFQTVLGNARDLRLSGRNWHYIDWEDEDASHPRTLCLGDLAQLEASPAHFARKLDLDACPELYDALDRMTGA